MNHALDYSKYPRFIRDQFKLVKIHLKTHFWEFKNCESNHDSEKNSRGLNRSRHRLTQSWENWMSRLIHMLCWLIAYFHLNHVATGLNRSRHRFNSTMEKTLFESTYPLFESTHLLFYLNNFALGPYRSSAWCLDLIFCCVVLQNNYVMSVSLSMHHIYIFKSLFFNNKQEKWTIYTKVLIIFVGSICWHQFWWNLELSQVVTRVILTCNISFLQNV